MNDFISIVNSYLNGTRMKYDKKIDELRFSDDIKKYKKNTGLRLIKSVIKYREGEIGVVDLMVSLRNYLIVFGESVNISKELLSEDAIEENSERFGLRFDGNGNVFAVPALPKYVNKKFVDNAFMRELDDQSGLFKSKNYFLGTSPFIYHLTGFKEYKSVEQKICVTGALKCPVGYTSMIALPTGGGKSLVTQTVAYQKEGGLTIVIVPTVSLALDQVRAAKNNIKHETENEIFCYYSGADDDQIERMLYAIDNETARIVFLSPEAIIKNIRISEAIKKANDRKYLKNIILDEAHIVIEWGGFFRVDYQFLEAWRKSLISDNIDIRTFLLSATFERKTVENLKLMFSQPEKFIEIRCDALRKEPRYICVESQSYLEKKRKYLELIDKLPRPMIVYVTSPDTAETLKYTLSEKGYRNVVTFTGKTRSKDRERIVADWASNEFDIVIATSAFGVGVDKGDVRTVLHLYVPENPNKYYQELGRGGRDGLPCLSVMCIYKDKDLSSAFAMTDKVLLEEKIFGRWFSMLNSRSSERTVDSILLDTTVKPSYSMKDYDEENDVNKTDMKWNIYVILLLRRYNLIDILDMIYERETQKYYINISVKNFDLFSEDEKSRSLVENIREKEWKKFESDFKKIKNIIDENKYCCWSEMFTDTYERVSEYCAGCESHDSIINPDYNKFPLAKRILEPKSMISERLSEFFSSASEVQISGSIESYKVIRKLVGLGVELVVFDNDCEIWHSNLLVNLGKDSCVNFMGISEFEDMIGKQSWYWISGSILLIYGDHEYSERERLLLLSKKISKNNFVQNLHLVDNSIQSRAGKSIADQIDGPHFESYIVESKEV